MRIGIVAPACPLDPAVPARLQALCSADGPDLVFHPQCFASEGHFAGSDAVRAAAFLEFANDGAFDALWFARGGYGSNRIALDVLPQLNAAARDKFYLGYSDMGFLLAGLYARGIGKPVHAPMVSGIKREGGAAAITRVLDWLADPRPTSQSPCVAFNMTVLSHLIGTPLEPDLSGHILMLEDVDEYHYRLDRMLFHITSHPPFAALKGIMLGRCDPVPENDRPFGQDEEQIARHWCARSGIPYLGRADIGHDVRNAVVPFG
jgi:muramoyltetrapeptide carboxypeptidase